MVGNPFLVCQFRIGWSIEPYKPWTGCLETPFTSLKHPEILKAYFGFLWDPEVAWPLVPLRNKRNPETRLLSTDESRPSECRYLFIPEWRQKGGLSLRILKAGEFPIQAYVNYASSHSQIQDHQKLRLQRREFWCHVSCAELPKIELPCPLWHQPDPFRLHLTLRHVCRGCGILWEEP